MATIFAGLVSCTSFRVR